MQILFKLVLNTRSALLVCYLFTIYFIFIYFLFVIYIFLQLFLDDVLQLSKLRANKLTLANSFFLPLEVMQTVVKMFSVQALMKVCL